MSGGTLCATFAASANSASRLTRLSKGWRTNARQRKVADRLEQDLEASREGAVGDAGWERLRPRAREREAADFYDLKAQREAEAQFGDADTSAIQATRLAEAAARVSNEEINRAYLAALASRLNAETISVRAQMALDARRGQAQPSSDHDPYSRLIDVVNDHHQKWRDRERVDAALSEYVNELLARLRADRANTQQGPDG